MTRASDDRCRALLEQLSKYVDGELGPDERRKMARHLRRCPGCQNMADSLKKTVETCKKAGRARLPDDVRRRARARITTLLASGAPHAPRGG
ncbi:MAG: zf-HC2 domain-containing protein [Acidobacteriota bacterium]